MIEEKKICCSLSILSSSIKEKKRPKEENRIEKI